ncbi:MAG: quinone oxidoreductase [Caulobacterales bacterium]|nr:quinone oxidoreductase [Caulobacterales bacterium]
MTSATVVRIHETGGPEVMRLEEAVLPPPGPGEAQVRHTAVGLNYIDTYHRSGLYPMALPTGLGLEAAGVVEEVGQGVTEVRPGQRVATAAAPLGAYASARNIEADRLIPLPNALDDRAAAALLLKGLTAAMLLRQIVEVAPGWRVLVHAAAGGVGQILCSWAKGLGADVIGTAGSPEKAGLARAAGCREVILYREENVAARVRELTGGEGVRVVYDGVGAATFTASLDSLARRGMMVTYGNASGPVPPVAPLELARRGSLFLTRPTMMDYTATREERLSTAAQLFDAVAAGHVRASVGQEFALAEAADAHRALEARATTGATLLIP